MTAVWTAVPIGVNSFAKTQADGVLDHDEHVGHVYRVVTIDVHTADVFAATDGWVCCQAIAEHPEGGDDAALGVDHIRFLIAVDVPGGIRTG